MSEAVQEDWGLDDLDPRALLDLLADEDLAERTAARNKLLIAHRWAVLHPATPDSGVSTWGGEALLADESLGGEGCPQVAAHAPEPLAIVLGVSPITAKQLITDALELRHRLPETWKRVAALEVPAWKGRHVAVLTHTLSQEAAGWVDKTIAPRLKRCGAKAGDDQPLGVRKVNALANLFTGGRAASFTGGRAASFTGGRAASFTGGRAASFTGGRAASFTGGRAASEASDQSRPLPRRTVLYLHLDLADLDDDTVRVGRAERLGPVTTQKIHEWLGRSDVRIQPVIRMDCDDAVNGHDPPDRMREQVILRDPTCQFPNCQIESRRGDLDHTVPYDPGGPPGQTRPSNLVPLCRRHHNAKTTGLWRYTRTPDGPCVWTGPYGLVGAGQT